MILTSKNKMRKIRSVLLGAVERKHDNESCGLCYYHKLHEGNQLFFNNARATRNMALQHPFMYNFIGLKFPLNKCLFFDHSLFKTTLIKLLNLKVNNKILVIFFEIKTKMVLNLPSLTLFNLFEDIIFFRKFSVVKIILRPFQIK